LSSLKGVYQHGTGWEGLTDFIISFEKLIPSYKSALAKVSYTIPPFSLPTKSFRQKVLKLQMHQYPLTHVIV